MEKDDWRLNGQEEYLYGETLIFKSYKSKPEDRSDHAHCEFCWHKFMENCEGVDDCSDAGYCTRDEKHWICKECFSDFKNSFNLTEIKG